MMMEYISEEEDKENKEENKESTHANASGISLAVRPLSRKYSLILPILSFRSRREESGSRYLFVVSVFFLVFFDSL
jgi:uncharacterized membrane protein